MALKQPHALVAAVAIVTFALRPAVAQESSAPAPANSAGAASLRADVTIEGQRAKLQPLIDSYVQQVAGSFYEQDLARWNKNVCPLVSGLTANEGEFILGRLSEVARAAGVPLAGEKCRPNLYILLTTQPQGLLRAMDKLNHYFTFGEASRGVIDDFIETARPVRVWYHTGATTPEGLTLTTLSFPSYVLFAPVGFGNNPDDYNSTGQEPVTQDRAPSGEIARGSNNWAHATRLSNNVIMNLFRAFVIVDVRQLQGATRGQIADYISMVALAEIKTEARPADGPTILNLFNAPAKSGAPGMSAWDQAYLKSLYATEQKSKLQRSQIAREMLREIVP